MTNETKAQILLSTAVKFLAQKHNVTEQQIADALGNNQKIRGQFADLVSTAIVAGA